MALRSEKQKTVQRKKENYKTLQLITDFEVSLMPIMAEKIKNNIAKDETAENIKTV